MLLCARAELSARTKTEEKYIAGRLHKALEKKGKQNYEGVNTRKLSFNTRKILRNSLALYFQVFSYFLCFCSVHTPLYTICLYFSGVFLRSHTCALRLTAVLHNAT